MRFNSRFIYLTLLWVIILAGVHTVLAQETTPVIPPDVLPVTDAASQLIALVLNFLAPFASSPLTTLLTQVLKMVVPESVASAALLKNIVAGVLTISYWLAVRYNFQDAFASVGGFLVTVLPAVFLLYKNFVGSSLIHEEAARAGNVLLGAKRS